MTLKYKLQEGLVDVRIFPADPVSGDQRYEIRYPEVFTIKMVRTPAGLLMLDTEDGSGFLVDKDFLNRYGVPMETVVNLNIPNALHALQE